MYTAPKNVYRDRVDFSKIKTSIPIPNLIEIQKNSYERFLQMRVLPSDREDAGLQSVFKSVFPIPDLRESCSLEQDADIVVLLHRPDEEQDLTEAIVAKHRNRATGTARLVFNGACHRFEELAQ